ncbi:hypothetical protein HNQ91_003643 [Filimonas zeae]|uniref:Uncharacterized protein n=1 Tax=Filimonas zeae TaxID=1737353 RepID=A0A917MXA2_9BACT|nr:hypothetical protein [Filimonas zeae]MDR6340578.1 hypothetical protein [Filimonas zeae]GGH73381.1 hypothetical protein GCM10011379_34840 [Filimonas zeae]
MKSNHTAESKTPPQTSTEKKSLNPLVLIQQQKDKTQLPYNPLQLLAAKASSYKPVTQKKVGFEIEVVGKRIKERKSTNPHYRALAKGEALHQAAGWKLTPDSKLDRLWTPEYIVKAIDETTNPEQIPVKIAEVSAHAANDLIHPGNWSNGQNISIENEEDEIEGNFHVTGGLRLSRISELIKILYPAGDDKSEGTDEALATRAEGISMRGANYKSVVALVALQISDLANSADRVEYLNGRTAKIPVSILSRTDLGAAVSKVSFFASKQAFINDVLTTAKVPGDTKLIKHQLPGSAVTGRSIDDQQDITVLQWLNKLLTGTDFVWSETRNDAGTAFGYDKVGESTLGHRADGIILELRALTGQEHTPLANWVSFAQKFATLFAMLNAKKDHTEIVNKFRE